MTRIVKSPNPDAPNTVLWQGHRPRMAEATLRLSQSVYAESTLTFREAEAARYRLSLINGCLLCQKFRVAEDLKSLMERINSGEAPNTGNERGDAPDEAFYDAIEHWRVSELFSEREKMAIEYAEHISFAPAELPLDDAFWQKLHAHFDDGEIVDLTYSITTWIATGRFVHVLGLDGVCDLPVQEAAE
jgi:alkylhydroperoxidase family enzyme